MLFSTPHSFILLLHFLIVITSSKLFLDPQSNISAFVIQKKEEKKEYARSNLTGNLTMKRDTTYPIILTPCAFREINTHNISFKIGTFVMPKASVVGYYKSFT